MSSSAEAVSFDADQMWVRLSDGRVLGVPLAWFPRLMHADRAALEAVEVTPFGLHWEALDEDVSVAGLLAGRGGVRRARTGARGAPVSAERPAPWAGPGGVWGGWRRVGGSPRDAEVHPPAAGDGG